MIQTILTYAVVLWAFYKTLQFFWQTLSPNKNKGNGCSSLGCTSCSAKQSLADDIKAGRYPNLLKE